LSSISFTSVCFARGILLGGWRIDCASSPVSIRWYSLLVLP
jgi:hypothetical protein